MKFYWRFRLVVLYGTVLLWFYLFGTGGMMAFTVFATIAANIEVMILVDAFGMEMTLGNILFATTFLVTDILSEVAGKRPRSVRFGRASRQTCCLSSSRSPAAVCAVGERLGAGADAGGVFQYAAHDAFPRLRYTRSRRSSTSGFTIKWWAFTEKRTGDHRAFLWLRNNGSTLVSQLVNTVLFTALAFWGTYDMPTLLSVALSSYVIFIFTSLLDTPVVYAARRLYEKNGRAAQED